MRNFRNLRVWEKSHVLTLRIYEATMRFPSEERFGLTSQLRRTAYSIPSNIAEGYRREGSAELFRFLQICSGSASELAYFLILARDLRYLSQEQFGSLSGQLDEVHKMLAGLIAKVRGERDSKSRGAGA